jgi:hypothetical protein
MEIVPYSCAHRDAIERMNMTLQAAGSEWQFPPEERPANADQLPVWMESFIAVDRDGAYGGYLLKHQQFFAGGRPLEVGDLQLPLSMGQIDGSYAHVSAALLIDVIRRSPVCYALGLGSEETQFAKLLGAAGWQYRPVPFYFSVKAANRFARNIRLPSDRSRLQQLLRLLGRLRLAGLALRLRRALGSRRSPERGPYSKVRELPRFDGAADELFKAHAPSYSLVGDRRVPVLNCLYPEGDERCLRIVVERDGRAIGWALLLDTKMRDNKYFGDMRVGTLADCFAAPEDAPAVVAAADDALTARGVDLVVSNQLHPAWCGALADAGYELGPSNFFFYSSEALREALSGQPEWENGIHMNRGDGEGPGHL